MPAADLAIPIRDALVGETAITGLLTAYNGSFPIFTRRPAPNDAGYPIIMVSPDISIGEGDGISDYRPIQQRDVAVYGQNDTSAKYRDIEALGYAVRELFHGRRHSIVVPDWHVIQINCLGPIPAPVDDDQTIARLVTLTVELARLS